MLASAARLITASTSRMGQTAIFCLLSLLLFTHFTSLRFVTGSSAKSKGSISLTPVPSFPLQFSADLKITAHLIEEESEYPPRYRKLHIYYDYINKMARADIEAGYEAAKTYIRRYDNSNEYMVRPAPINDCKRSYLGEIMPFPDIHDSVFVSKETINGVPCNYFLHEEHDVRVHIYLDASSYAPVRLVQESFDNKESTPLLTYDYEYVTIGPPDVDVFTIPPPYTHETCTKHAGGFPYLHIFHYFVKF